jgi:hypothetical protein
MKKVEEIEKLKKLLEQGAISREEFFSLVEEIALKSNDHAANENETESFPKIEHTNPAQPKVEPDLHSQFFANFTQKQTNNAETIYNLPDKMTLAGEKLKLSAQYQVWSRILGVVAIIIFMYNSMSILTSLMTTMSNHNDLQYFNVVSIFGLGSFICWIASVVYLYQAGKILEYTNNKFQSPLLH